MWSFFKSRKLAIFLIASAIGLLLLANFIPQEGVISQAELSRFKEGGWFPALLFWLGFTHIFSSFWFLALIVLLFLNTLACLTSQSTKVYRKLKKEPRFPSSLKELRGYQKLEGKAFDEDDLTSLLKKKRYRVWVKKGKEGLSLVAHKGRLHSWAKLIFHLALLLIFLGAALTALLRFSGTIELTEGEITKGREKSFIWHNRPLVFSGYPQFSLKLVRFEPTYYSDKSVKSLESIVRVADVSGVVEKRLDASTPLSYSGYRIYQLVDSGVSAFLVLIDKKGMMLESSFIPFYRSGVPQSPLGGSHHFTKKSLSLEGLLYPSPKEKKGEISLASYKLDKPLLTLQIKDKGKSSKATLRLGQLAEFDDYSIYFEEARYWTRFQVVSDPGAWPMFFGFGLALVGLVFIYLLTEKSVFVKVNKISKAKASVELAGQVLKRRGGFRDFDIILGALKDWMGVAGR